MAKKNNLPAGRQGKKILIVEDDEDFLSILKIKFETGGFSVVTASDGLEGLSAVEKEKPDLVMTDVLMPKMDGLEMAKKIQAADKNMKVVFLTNITDVSYTDEIKKNGKFEYLVKSELTINDIFEKIKAKLGLA